jgi:hypothetical protein
MDALQSPDWYDEVDPRDQVFRDLFVIDDNTIKKYYRDRFKQLHHDAQCQALVGYLDKMGLTWAHVAHFVHRAQHGRWSRGLAQPSPETLDEIKRINKIRDEDLGMLPLRICRLTATADTLRLIREARDPKPEPPHEIIDGHQYHILEFVFQDLKTRITERTAVRDEFMADIALYVHEKFPQARIQTLGDLDRLLSDWIAPYVIFAGVLKKP